MVLVGLGMKLFTWEPISDLFSALVVVASAVGQQTVDCGFAGRGICSM
jgi:hypothetical protein